MAQGQRGRVRFRDRPSYSNRPNSNNDILLEIIDRLDRLEQRSRSSSRNSTQRNSFKNNYNNNREQYKQSTSNANRFVSQNPDFTRMVRQTFSIGQLAHHRQQWKTCPPSISENIDNIIGNIKPPRPNDELKDALERSARIFKRSIEYAVSRHIETETQAITDTIAELDQTDIDRAKQIARMQLERRLGARMMTSSVDHALANVGRKQTTRRSTQIVINSRSPKTVDNDKADTIADAVDAMADPPLTDVIAKRKRADDDRSDSDDSEDKRPPGKTTRRQVNSTPASIPGTSIVFSPATSSWQLKLSKQVRRVIIADSNGRRWPDDNIPSGTVLHAFPGARLEHVMRFAEHIGKAPHITDVVVAVGVNDYQTDFEEVQCHLQDLESWATNKKIRVTFVSIPVLPTMPAETKLRIRCINNTAADLFENNYVIAINPDDVTAASGDTSGLHYDEVTARAISNAVYNIPYFL